MATQAAIALAQLLEPHALLAWLATYLLHSTLLLGGAWIASRWLRGRRLDVEERLWKAALLGGLLTATVQTGLAALAASPVEFAGAVAESRATVPPAALLYDGAVGPGAQPAAAQSAPDPRLRQLGAILPGWQRLVLAAWLGGGLLLCGALAWAWLRLRLRLRGRQDVSSGAAPRLLERLLARTAARRRVRLTGSSALPVPIALGVAEREICLPRRALRELDARRQEGLLAHELAHLERRDPAWLLGALTLQSLFFFQPLNRLARRRMEEISELQCDAWAVRATGDRVGLARCLTEVASWLVAERAALPAPGMARTRGRLGERVRRILAEGTDEPAGPRWVPATAAAGLLAAALLVPGLAPASFADPDGATAQTTADRPATPPAAEEAAPEGGADGTWERASGGPTGQNGEPRSDAAPGPDDDLDHDFDVDYGVDSDVDFDFDFSGLPDTLEISRQVAAAMAAMPDPETVEAAVAAAMAAMPDPETVEAAIAAAMAVRLEALEEVSRALELELEGRHDGREPSAADEARVREAIARELALTQEEMARALAAARPRLEALERMELDSQVADELRRAARELERAQREIRREIEREVRVERDEIRHEMERELRDERRQLERERRELERVRQALEEEARRLEAERPPPVP